MTRQIRLVVNPSAGKGRALEILPDVAGSLRDGGANLEILLSRDFAEAKSMAHQAIADGVDVLAVMGGDGMMHLGVNTSAAAHAGRTQPYHAGPDSRRDRQRPVPRHRPSAQRRCGCGGRSSPQATAAQSILLEWPRPMSRRCLPPVSTLW